MCTNLLGSWERERGWRNLRLYTDLDGAYTRDYLGILGDGSEIPALNVFSPAATAPFDTSGPTR